MAERSKRDRWLIIATIVVIVAAIAAVAVITLGNSGSASASVTLEPAGAAGADPFTASVAIGPAAEFPGNVQAITAANRKGLSTDPKTHTLVAVGTAPGLYGGSGDTHVCDAQQLVTFLNQNPSKAAAWASVLGIAPSDIGRYVASFTPVVLTADTFVTNHGYHDGKATSLQSVLQAGTAVMVDATGTPRVKCNCGNPLTPPEPIQITNTNGPPWPGYTPTQVVVVNPSPPVINITVINIITGDPYPTPVGSGGGGTGGQFVATSIGDAGYQTKFSTSPDGTTWTATQLKEPNPGVTGLTWGNGKWMALSLLRGKTNVYESTDLHAWNQVATIPTGLSGMAYGNGRWIAVGGEDDGDIGRGVVYGSTDGHTWTRVAGVERTVGLTSVAYGNGVWVAVTEEHQFGDHSFTVRSTDGTTWTKGSDQGLTGQDSGRIAFGSGQWAIGGGVVEVSGGGSPNPDGVISVSTNGTTWTSGPGAQFARNQITGIAYGNGEWLAIGKSGDVFSSPDAKTWTKKSSIHGGAFDLSFGGGTTTGTPAPSATTTTQPTTSLTGIDWKNYSYLDHACGTDKLQKLTNGSWTLSDPTITCGMSFVAVDYADVTGDGVTDAIVNLHVSASGVALGESDWTIVFTASRGAPVNHGFISGASFAPYSASAGITTWNPDRNGTDPTCCPSHFLKDVYKYSSATGQFAKTGSTSVPASELPTR